jgi:AraC-like DNA-binding protein
MSELASAPESVTIGEIASAWGFYDTSHMTRTFQRSLGTTPTQYRQTQRDAQPKPSAMHRRHLSTPAPNAALAD